MAVNLSIKGVPDELAARLREQAAANHRSLQGELMAILEAAAAGRDAIAAPRPRAMAVPSDWRKRLALMEGASRLAGASVEQVIERIKASRGKAAKRGESSVALVRAMRDERHGVAPAQRDKPRRGG